MTRFRGDSRKCQKSTGINRFCGEVHESPHSEKAPTGEFCRTYVTKAVLVLAAGGLVVGLSVFLLLGLAVIITQPSKNRVPNKQPQQNKRRTALYSGSDHNEY